MATLLLLEDSLNNIRIASEVARQAGFSEIEALVSPSLAVCRLGNAIEDRAALPDLLFLDLDLGMESGFGLLRFDHSNRLQIKLASWFGAS